MSCLDYLIAADRVVIAGLAAYDRAMANGWVVAAEAMASDGVPPEDIEAAKAGHDERTLLGRGELHRELWTKALAMLADTAPDADAPQSGE